MTDKEKLLKIEELRIKLEQGIQEWLNWGSVHVDVHIFRALEYFEDGKQLGWDTQSGSGKETAVLSTTINGNTTLYR